MCSGAASGWGVLRPAASGGLNGLTTLGLVRAGDSGTSRHKFVGSLGHTSEDETGLIYMRARWMDPSLGRFISEDPARDGANWLEYCRGNPVNAVDPDGRSYVSVFQGLMVALGMVLGQTVGYGLTTALLEATNPGYSGGSAIMGGLLLSAGLGAAQLLASFWTDTDMLKKGGMSIAAFAKGLSRAMRTGNTTLLRVGATSAGIGFTVGVICGVASALYEYFASDYYQHR